MSRAWPRFSCCRVTARNYVDGRTKTNFGKPWLTASKTPRRSFRRNEKSGASAAEWMFRTVPARRSHLQKSASLRQHTLDVHSSFRNTENVIAVSPGAAGVKYSFLTTESADAHASVGAAGVFGSS